MDVFGLLPRVKARRRLEVFACAMVFVLASSALAGSAFAQSSSSSSNPAGTPGINNPKTGTVSTGNYIPPAPPSGPDVYYDRPWEFYAGATYTNFLAGPALIQRSNLGGWEADGSYWRNWHWGLMADSRMYIGTSGVYPNNSPVSGPISGPRIMQYYFMAGPEYRLFRRTKGSATIHAIFGQAYGIFDAAHLLGLNVQTIGLFATQWTFSGAVGATYDYNYTSHIAFRIQPEILLTHYGGTAQQNFGFSVGPIIRLGKVNKPRYQEHGNDLWP
ncbi:MAG TPA: hypothetical protein VMU62_06400 [Acidobacteriaceae bacterium]|nr:hypothetical protein [Acidobacteriaceae bacterium]